MPWWRTEELTLKNAVTRSGAGTGEEPENRVAQKGGLEREILTPPWAVRFFFHFKVQSAETGGEWVDAPPANSSPASAALEAGMWSEKQLHRSECTVAEQCAGFSGGVASPWNQYPARTGRDGIHPLVKSHILCNV